MDFIPGGSLFAVPALILIGFSVGVCGGFFGVGGAFIVTPALNVLGFPMVYAIGTDLAHMAGKSVAASLKHHRLGNIDWAAAGLLMLGTTPGVRLGVAAIHSLEGAGKTDVIVRFVYIALLLTIGLLMLREKDRGGDGKSAITLLVSRLKLPPVIHLRRSGISVSAWVVVGIGFLTGFLASFLGVGGGFIRMPALLYFLGMPAKIAVGTDLVEVLYSGAYGSYLYGQSGHVDLTAALVMLVGAALGANIGAVATQYVDAAEIKWLFTLTVLGAAAAVTMKQVGLTIPAAVILFGVGLGMTVTVIGKLIRSVKAERVAKTELQSRGELS